MNENENQWNESYIDICVYVQTYVCLFGICTVGYQFEKMKIKIKFQIELFIYWIWMNETNEWTANRRMNAQTYRIVLYETWRVVV